MKIELKSNKQGQIYLPKFLRDEWGDEYFLIPNTRGGGIFPRSVKAKDALRSLGVVRKILEDRVELEQASDSDSKPKSL